MPTTEGQVGFGIVGCGRIGRWHAKTVRGLLGAELIAVSDVDELAREKAARRFGAVACCSAELLRSPEVDVVSVCTPPATHADLAVAAASAGKHVLVEKPLAPSLAEADRVITACEGHGVHLGVVHQQRARSASRAARTLIGEGALGALLTGSAVHTWRRRPEQLETWRGAAAAGGGLLLDQAIHAIDLLIWFLGEPLWATGATAALTGRTESEDSAVAAIGFADGALATLTGTMAANVVRDDIAIDVAGTRGAFRLEVRDYDHAEIVALQLADSGALSARRLSHQEIEELVRLQGGRWREGPSAVLWRWLATLAGKNRGGAPFRSPRAFLRRVADRVAQSETGELQGHAAVLQSMASAARGTGGPLVTGVEARRALAVIEAVARSNREGGRRVMLSSLTAL